MNRYNHLINSYFASCECLAVVWDEARNRRVRFFDIGPAGALDDGTFIVGYADYEPTTDTPQCAFIVPAVNPHRGLDLVHLIKVKEVRVRGLTNPSKAGNETTPRVRVPTSVGRQGEGVRVQLHAEAPLAHRGNPRPR